jgi:predicted TIM-barrel fold metal-dependent hydrolase
MALNRKTTETIQVKRLQGKIAIEEAVGSPYWKAHLTYPSQPMIQDLDGLPFCREFLADIDTCLDDVELRLHSMDQSGISYAVVSLTAPGVEGIFDPDVAVEFARKTNDAIHEKYVKAYPDRFGFFACLPTQRPEAAATELERAVTKLGAKGCLVNGFCNLDINDQTSVQYLDDPACEAIWAMLAKLKVPLYLHPRCPPLSQQRLYRDYPNLAQAAYGFGVETAGHALRIMCSGVLDRHPSVRIILGHCAEGLPFLIHRIDHRMAISTPGTNGAHTRDMMYYLQKNFYATCAGVRRESTLKNTIEEMGEGRVLFSVDYPYESNEDAADWFDALQMNENTREVVARGNAMRLLNIE